MAATESAEHYQWRPPPRPAWVEHLNAMGQGVDATLVMLDADEMIATAASGTGLSDFGPGSWRQHYKILVDAINEQAELHTAGKLLTRAEILRTLRNRLYVEAYIAEHPGALERPVEAPLVVCGYGRSGTSITQELLSLHPDLHAPLAWELFNVSPLSDKPGSTRDERIRFAEGEQLFYGDVTPEFKAMHENGAELPVECLMFQMHEFLSAQFFGQVDAPNYLMHAMMADRTTAYEYEYRMLQVMQHQRPGTRWVLKGPTHQDRFEVLFKVFPDARVVQMHRDPRKMIPSTYSLMGSLRWMRSHRVDLSALAFMPSTMQATLEKVIRQRASGEIPGEQIYDLLYADLVRDPVGSIRSCCDFHGLPFSDDLAGVIQEYVASKPKGKHGAHSYTLEEFGLDEGQLGEMFKTYLAHYGVPAEESA